MLGDKTNNPAEMTGVTSAKKDAAKRVWENFDERFSEKFPAPSPRDYQKETVKRAFKDLWVEDKDLVMVDAPPGFGKSITLWTLLSMSPGKHYYITPLKSLQEQLQHDSFIGDGLTQIQGRNNYLCNHPEHGGEDTVDKAICQRESEFQCDFKDMCPYFSQKYSAIADKVAVGNMSYMMKVPVTLDQGDGQFSPRTIMVIDECQGIDDWGLNQVSFTISKRTVPNDVWKNIEWPDEDKRENYNEMLSWVEEEVHPKALEAWEYLNSMGIKTESQLSELERLKDFVDRAERFLDDAEDNYWVHTYDYEIKKNKPNEKKVVFEPIKIGRFLKGLLYRKADKLVLASATVPKGSFQTDVGIDDMKATRIGVPSGFPVENRPIITSEAVGKMTYNERDKNIGPMVEKIKDIAAHHEGEKGLIHCRGYNYAKMFKDQCIKKGYKSWYDNNVHIQDREDREGSLEEWVDNDKQIFLSVNMAEGIDLKGDKCRWQVLLKTLYPNMGNKRISYRVNEMNDWTWYNGKAVIQIEQAYGRAVRSEDDWAIFYILDSSAVGLIKRNKNLFHDWFLEAVDINA